LLVNGVTVAQLTDPTLPTPYETALAIRDKLLQWSPAVFIGYNSIRFDEEFLRRTFYKNLLPAYLTNTDGNCRADVMKMAHHASIVVPEALECAWNANRRRSFKLSLLVAANGYKDRAAHEARADVHATIYVARVLKRRAPAVWSAAMRFSDKDAVIKHFKIR